MATFTFLRGGGGGPVRRTIGVIVICLQGDIKFVPSQDDIKFVRFLLDWHWKCILVRSCILICLMVHGTWHGGSRDFSNGGGGGSSIRQVRRRFQMQAKKTGDGVKPHNTPGSVTAWKEQDHISCFIILFVSILQGQLNL